MRHRTALGLCFLATLLEYWGFPVSSFAAALGVVSAGFAGMAAILGLKSATNALFGVFLGALMSTILLQMAAGLLAQASADPRVVLALVALAVMIIAVGVLIGVARVMIMKRQKGVRPVLLQRENLREPTVLPSHVRRQIVDADELGLFEPSQVDKP